jgi:agmatinase
MTHFNPNAAAAADSGIFGLPYTVAEAKIVLIPVPWEATTSYGRGTAKGPQVIMNASKQVDLFDLDLGNIFEAGIAMLPESSALQQWNTAASEAALAVIDAGGYQPGLKHLQQAVDDVNAYSQQVNDYVYTETKKLLAQNKVVGVIGGDHSTPFGAIAAHLEKYPEMGILHFDAHADLRVAYEGFEHSHASIMYNVIAKTSLTKLVQVGIRDFCEEEMQFIKQNPQRIITFFDANLLEQKMSGKTWGTLCDEIIQHLPPQVYVSFDIDGLDPRFCPHTGTPVPGGLELSEALFLMKKVAQSGRKIIGFDLNEVSPGANYDTDENSEADPAAEWDANVAARLLYKLCGWSAL